MDEAIIEKLSRYIDGDLGPADEQDVWERLQEDPDLRAKLEGLERLRVSLSSLAEKEEVPAELDALVEPLRRGNPEAVTVRPWVRWLATAAVAVLGLSVIIEVNQRGSGESAAKAPRPQHGRPAEPTERFSLAPLPTSPVPPEDQLLGISERLLASPIPEMEIDESPALQVLGPLEAPPDAKDDGARRKTEGAALPATIGEPTGDHLVPSTPSDSGKGVAGHVEAHADNAPGRTREDAPEDEKLSPRSAARQFWNDEESVPRAQLFVFVGDKTAWQEFDPRARCATGRYILRIKIGGGAVREVWPVGVATTEARSKQLCAGEIVRGLIVSGVADGEYAAEVLVEPRGAGYDR